MTDHERDQSRTENTIIIIIFGALLAVWMVWEEMR